MSTPVKIALIAVSVLLVGAVIFYSSARSTLQLLRTDYIVDFRDWSRIKIQRAGSTNVVFMDRAGLMAALSQTSAEAKRKPVLLRYVGKDDFFYMPEQAFVTEVEAVLRAAGFTTIQSAAPAAGNRQQAFFERQPSGTSTP